MAMSAKGIDPMARPKRVSREIEPSKFLGLGFILIGFGIGLLMGSLLEALTQINSEVAHFSMIFIFGGLGLLGSYFYQMNVDKKNQANKGV
jgi:flagellar biosynthesis protein FliQ